MKITCIPTVTTASLVQAVQRLRGEHDLDLDLRIYHPHSIDEELVDSEELEFDLKTSDVVLVDIRGSGRSTDTVCQALKDGDNIVINLMSPTSKIMAITRLGSFRGSAVAGRIRPGEVRDAEEVWRRIARMEKMIQTAGKLVPLGPMRDASNYVQICRYWRYGGVENYRNMILLLLRDYQGLRLPPPKDPHEPPEYGIYHPSLGHFADLDEYLIRSGYDPARPTIGILFYGNMHFDQCLPTLEALVERLRDFNFIPVFSDSLHNLLAMRKFFFCKGQPILDLLVNLTLFRLNGGPLGGDHQLTRELLKELDVPVITPASMYSREIEHWSDSETGLSPIETIMAVIWPELDGCIEPIPCCGIQSVDAGGLQASQVAIIPDRLDRLAGRLAAWARLKKKPIPEKRVAVIIYDYPPGEENLGRASYLDVFKSLKTLLAELRAEGYSLNVPGDDLPSIFEEMAAVNTGMWLPRSTTLKRCPSLEVLDYEEFFSRLPLPMREEMLESWGQPPGEVMVEDGRLLIPGIDLGNVFVGVQPARPPLDDQDISRASHDKTRPPHHQYLAFYHWLQDRWKADVVVHLGTHGLAEFTKGKEVGMSSRCFPDLLIGNLPHLYFYHVVNTSEVVIAKRRLYGTIVGYNSPAYTTSGLYEKYEVLQALIDEHSEARVQDPGRCARVEELILAKAEELHFSSARLEEIHDELYRMRRRIIPQGLHVLGEEYGLEARKRYLEFVLRYDRDGARSLNRILAEARGVDYDLALKNREDYLDTLKAVDSDCIRLADMCFDGSLDEAVMMSSLAGQAGQELARTLSCGLSMVRDYADNRLELHNFLRGLCTQHIEQAGGGDVIRSPEVLPTGRNLTQFDPTRIPTATALERGKEIAERTLEAYRDRAGGYPGTVGIVLWGFETTKTGGESVGQILHYLGLRLERMPGAWSPRLAPMSLQELGRPRIDCLVNICGFFRDMFPNVAQLLDQAFNLVAELDEPPERNFVRKHSLENRDRLMQGLQSTDQFLDHRSLKELRKMANGRVFGPRAGEYGTRMLPLVEDSVWQTEDELAEVFIQSMNHLYAENIHAQKNDLLYRANLERVDVVSQVRDSTDREVIDLDHYFEFFGGLSSAVRLARGREPQMLITDTTEVAMETADIRETVTRAVRTRLLNPRWISGMLEHDFHGAQQVAERMENMLGLAATTGSVEGWIWSSLAKRYLFDREVLRRLVKNNKYAAMDVAERLLEAQRRGYWKATIEELEKLRDICLEIEGGVEEVVETHGG